MTAWFLLVFIVQSARFPLVFEQLNYTRKQQTGQPFLSCPVLFWGLMQQPHAVPFFDSWRIWRNYSVFRGENRRLSLLWATFKSELRNLYCLAHFLKMSPFGKQKSTCFQYRKQVLGELFGFGSGKLPFPLFNPTANQDNRKHSDHNHSGNPYGRKHPYPTPLDNSQQLQHNKDNRQNGNDAKPALFCFIIHIVS